VSGRSRRAGQIALACSAALITFLILALVGEAASRYRERHRGTLGGTMPLLYYQHVRLRHALVRNFDYFGWIHVNGQGFRGPEVSVAKAPGTLRVMMVGSSTTFDPGVSSDQATWPARLQVLLNGAVDGRPVEVINAGVPGYTMIDDVIRLETELYQYQPDVVVLYEGHNDLFGAMRRGREGPRARSDTPGEIRPQTPWDHWLTRHSLLYGKVVSRIQLFSFGAAGRRALADSHPEGASDDDIVEAGARRFERDLTTFLSVAKSFGFRVVVPELVQASGVGVLAERDPGLLHEWSYTVPFAPPSTVLRAYVRYNEVLRTVAERFGATWVPTASFGLAGASWYEDGDPIHFNDHGSERMAQRLASALLASGLLRAGGADRAGTSWEVRPGR
jgi:lysophospholipase L1-like esterase